MLNEDNLEGSVDDNLSSDDESDGCELVECDDSSNLNEDSDAEPPQKKPKVELC